MQTHNWRPYWNNYLLNKHGKKEVKTEEDLFFQVGLTINKKPVNKNTFARFIPIIKEGLSLKKTDILIDLCCGNGLFTFELKEQVAQIYGVDFSSQSIDTAKKLKNAKNITYCAEEIEKFLGEFATNYPGIQPNKYLMNDSIAYFSPEDIERILKNIISLSPAGFTFMLRGGPNDALKWNYYNTEERKATYLSSVANGDITNGGLGRWWSADEILPICKKLNLNCAIYNQDPTLYNYRMDVVISKNKL